MTCFACRVEGLATQYIDAADEKAALEKLQNTLNGIADPYGKIESIAPVE